MITLKDFEDIISSDDYRNEAKKCYELALKMVQEAVDTYEMENKWKE